MNETGDSEKRSRGAGRSFLLGLGLDGADGQKRITRAERFSVVGGSEETHDCMTETFIKTCEDLRRKGRDLDDADPREISDLLGKHLSGN